MAQIFHPSMNTFARVTIFGAVFFAVGVLGAAYVVLGSPYVTRQNEPVNQPVQFSHEHHVGALGLDCRYCHTSVESSSFAGVPPTETCMTCHSQIWRDSPILEPVRQSLATNQPIPWNRVHDLPEYAFFNHAVHLKKGVGCASCHGRVDQMPLTAKDQPLTMEWCLGCHREPEKHLRPADKIFDMAWAAASANDQLEQGRELIKLNHVPVHRLSDCSTCHR
jgi:Cytochrome c7 and related cytochrome c/Class III cytochrome C family